MSMTLSKAREVLDLLLRCGINANFVNDRILVNDGDNLFLFSIDFDEEWEEFKKIFLAVARELEEEK